MKKIFLICYMFFFVCEINAQEETDSLQEEKKNAFDKIIDVLEFRSQSDRDGDTTKMRMKLVISPIVSFTPETSLGVGAGMKLLFKPHHAGEDTRTSNMPISAVYTLKNQVILKSGYTIFFNHENWMLKGNIGYSKFPQLFFGIGNNTPKKNEELIEYRNFLLEPLLLKRVVGKLFLGGGIRYNNIWNVKHRSAKDPDKLIQPYEFDETIKREELRGYNGSVSSGLQLAVTYDSRDNVLNAFEGSLLEYRHGFYGEIFNGVPYGLSNVDLRKYMILSKKRRDVLALQGVTVFSDGAPVLEMAALGGKQLMRGYFQGRFMDRNMFAGQVEYRFPIINPIGMVAFAGTGQVFDHADDIRFNQLKFSYGAGLRIKIVKSEDLNLRIDVAKGEKLGLYFGIAEAF